MLTIQAPATYGKTVEICGTKVGRFPVHKDLSTRALGSGDVAYGWSVSLIANGLRFPWVFKTKKAASSFAAGVEKLMDWDSVECDVPIKTRVKTAAWRIGPSEAQRTKVNKFAAKCGGHRT